MGARDDDHNSVLRAFLEGCRPVRGPALAFLTARGVDPGVVADLRVRLCGPELGDLYVDLAERFGEQSVEAAGIVGWRSGRRYLAFLPYLQAGLDILVFPYRQDGLLRHLRAHPPMDRPDLRGRGLPRSLGTREAAPFLFNVDALAGSDRAVVCRGEIDALTAESHGYRAVGVPEDGPFLDDWIRPLADKDEVFLLVDDREVLDPRLGEVARALAERGGPAARVVEVPAGRSLKTFLERARRARWRWNLFQEVARKRQGHRRRRD